MCIRIKKLRSHTRIGLLFCLALSAVAATRGGQPRPLVTPVAGVSAQTPATLTAGGPVAIALATHD